MHRNEAQTRFELIDPALLERGWKRSDIFMEETARAVESSMERVSADQRVVQIMCCADREAIVKKTIVTHGPMVAAEKFKMLGQLDKRIGTILSPVSSGRAEDCIEAAQSFLNGLNAELGEGFLFEP